MACLYSDLTSLSATGFTHFPFEKIAVLRSDNQGDHLLVSEEEKEKQEQEDAKSRPLPPNLVKHAYEQLFENSIPPTTKEGTK
jgi:hypothetical protein